MTADLGMDEASVHGRARTVLDFWFGLAPKDDALDREIAERFGVLRDQLLATDAERACLSQPDAGW